MLAPVTPRSLNWEPITGMFGNSLNHVSASQMCAGLSTAHPRIGQWLEEGLDEAKKREPAPPLKKKKTRIKSFEFLCNTSGFHITVAPVSIKWPIYNLVSYLYSVLVHIHVPRLTTRLWYKYKHTNTTALSFLIAIAIAVPAESCAVRQYVTAPHCSHVAILLSANSY
ncbi:hypothetical protein J6590_003132 [Homalodisca vitripennis]|nr:hypothetical protein J6590_003132 [Homalodisca vitripennis]